MFGCGVVRKDFPLLLRWIMFLIVALVGFSRLYLGVHTPQDVLVGAAYSILVMWLTLKLMRWLEEHPSAEEFCLLWTRLESALKAEGCGLAAEERSFSLLEENRPWHWESVLHDGHTVTCAALGRMEVELTVLPAHELLK